MSNITGWMISLLMAAGQGPQQPLRDTLPVTMADCHRCLLLAEQSQARIAIADVAKQKIVWEWRAASSNVAADHVQWFNNPSDVKPVYGGRYLLITASGGGVALVRIADRKTVFYAYAGGNTHSVELLPDGNIVAASSNGNFLTLFKMDSTVRPGKAYSRQVPVAFAHNVVWDARHQLLWTAAMNEIKAFRYNFDCNRPDLELVKTIQIPGTEAHDLFPVYGTDSCWLTNTTHVYKFSVATGQWVKTNGLLQQDIKSVSSGPDGFPVIVVRPKEQWWTDEVLDANGRTIFRQTGLKIYKARWWVPNRFSYGTADTIRQCQ